jgi:hypothetical protein
MVRTRFPYRAMGHRFDEHGLPVEWFHGPYAQVALGRREYALLRRVLWPRPWRVRLAPYQTGGGGEEGRNAPGVPEQQSFASPDFALAD